MISRSSGTPSLNEISHPSHLQPKGVALWDDVGEDPIHAQGGPATVLFTGSSEHTIDDKKRLSIASKHRSLLPDGATAWYCVPWPSKPTGVLRLYPESTFLELSNKWEDSLTLTDDQAELMSALFSLAERIEMDSAGRVRLPQKHLELVGIGSAVVVLGARNKLEVRSGEGWQDEERKRFEDLSRLVATTTRSSAQ